MRNDFTYEGLFYPDRRPVFEGAEAMPSFDDHNRDYSLVNAWWLANACQLAYCQDCDVEQTLEGIGWHLAACFSGECTQGYLATGPGFGVLVFRGTEIEALPDILADADFQLCQFQDIAQVHQGFRDALDEVWVEVERALDELAAQGVPAWYTGYSLGAAMAALAAARRPPVALYTFGSPRVGDEAFTRLLRQVPTHRFVNCTDIVTTVPPPPLGYWHFGRQHFITDDGRLMHDPESWHVARRRLAGQYHYLTGLHWLPRGNVKSRPLADHAIVNYTAGIRQELDRGLLAGLPRPLAWVRGFVSRS